MRSLRARLMAGTAIATTTVLVAAAAALYLLVRAALLHSFDDGLQKQAQAIASMAETKDGKVKFEIDAGELPEFQPSRRPEYFELFDAKGQTIAKSPSLAAAELARNWPGEAF